MAPAPVLVTVMSYSMVAPPSPSYWGVPTRSLVTVTMANGAHALASSCSPLVVSEVSLRKPVPVSPPARVQSDEALVAVAGSVVTVAVTR